MPAVSVTSLVAVSLRARPKVLMPVLLMPVLAQEVALVRAVVAVRGLRLRDKKLPATTPSKPADVSLDLFFAVFFGLPQFKGLFLFVF